MAKFMKKALTIPEVLIAAIFLAVVLSGILMLFINCMLLNEANRNSTVAITHAQYVMEEVRGTSFASLQDIADGDPCPWDLDVDDLQAAPYNLDEEKEILDSEGIETSVEDIGDLLEVTVDVSWEDRRGRSRSEQLVTRIADYQ